MHQGASLEFAEFQYESPKDFNVFCTEQKHRSSHSALKPRPAEIIVPLELCPSSLFNEPVFIQCLSLMSCFTMTKYCSNLN